MKHKIFVYGTLKKGHGNNRIMMGAALLGAAKTVEPYLLMDFGGFPGMYQNPKVKEPELTQIQGELWEIDSTTLAACDRLEGHPHFYKRTPIDVLIEDPNPGTCEGEIRVKCQTYFYQGAVRGTPCVDGVWPRSHKLEKV